MTMDANITTTLSDNSIKDFLGTFIEHPFLIIVLLFIVWLGVVLYKERENVFEILKAYFFINFHRRKIAKNDLLEHQLFKDLDYWIDYRVNQMYGQTSNHSYDKAKIAMARAMLLLKLKDSKLWLQDFVHNTNFELASLEDIKVSFLHKKEKHRSIQWNEYKKRGIPQKFIEKFVEVSRIHETYVMDALAGMLSEKIPMTIYEKLYLVLNFLSTYYTTLIVETGRVVDSINGDLKGEIFDGMIVGGNEYKSYPVPNREYIPLVETKLNEILMISRASRASIFIFHDFIGDDYLQGCISRIYEYEVKGFSPVMGKFQYKPAICVSDMIQNWKRHEGFCSEISDVNDMLKEFLVEIGVEAIITYPMFLGGQLKGFIGLEYSNLEVFRNQDLEKVLGIIKKYSSILNIYIDYRKTGLSYEGNSLREIREDRGEINENV